MSVENDIGADRVQRVTRVQTEDEEVRKEAVYSPYEGAAERIEAVSKSCVV